MQFELSGRRIDLGAGLADGVPLRPIEVRLLRYLVERRERAVPQNELLQQVWGYSPRTRTRTLYSTLHRLRQTLERDPSAPRHLITVSGVGVLLTDVSGLAVSAPLIGREALLDALSAVGPGLVALVGPGGVGKTKLAIAYLAKVGGTVCDLTGCLTVADATARVSAAVGVTPEAFDSASGVWILDAADGLDDLGPTVLAWAAAAPRLQIVVTTRMTLPGARQIRVPPLGAIGRELLIRCVESYEPSFDPEPVNALLDALVERLDGWPLALELAAKDIAMLGPAEVLAGIDMGELPGDSNDSAGSLRGIVGWSVERLPAVSREALRQLSTFSRSFTLSIASSVVQLPEGSPHLRAVLVSLVAAGLVRSVGEDQRRFAVLQVVRTWHGRPTDGVLERLLHIYTEQLRSRFDTDDLPRPRPADLEEIDEWVQIASIALRTPNTPLRGELIWWALVLLAECDRRAEYIALLEASWSQPLAERDHVFIGLHMTFSVFGRSGTAKAFPLYCATASSASALGLHAVAAILHARYAAVLSNADDLEGVQQSISAAMENLRQIPHPTPRFAAEVEAHCMLVTQTSENTVAYMEEALIRATTSQNAVLINSVRQSLSGELLSVGRHEDALRLAELSRDSARQTRGLGMSLLCVAQSLLALRRFQEALKVAEQMEEISRRKLPLLLLYANLIRCEVFAETGLFSAALAVIEESERLATQFGHGSLVTTARSWRAIVERRKGNSGSIGLLWSAFETVLHASYIGQTLLIAGELVDAWKHDASSVDPHRVLDRLTQDSHQRLYARLLRAEVLRSMGLRAEALVELSAPVEAPSVPMRTSYVLSYTAAACEIGHTRAHVPTGAAWDSRWAAVHRHRIARATGDPPEGSLDLDLIEIGTWENLLFAAVSELRAVG